MRTGKEKKESGAIIVEATISLSVFMFAIVTILFVVHICYAQAKIGTVIDGVAKDLSEFSYVYSLTGFADKQSQISSQASQATQGIDKVVDNLDNVTDTLGNLKEVGSSLVNDSEMRSSMLALLKNEAYNKVGSILTSQLVKQFAKGRLAGKNGDCETVLKRFGVQCKAGTYLGSIDFGDSVFCVNGSSEIKIVARYSVKLITLLNIDITYDICQCASTKAWGAAQKSDDQVAEQTSTSEESTTEESTTQEQTTEEETEKEQKSLDDIAKGCTKNPSSNQVMLGAGNGLIVDANRIGATYFVLNENDIGNYDKWEVQKKLVTGSRISIQEECSWILGSGKINQQISWSLIYG